MHKISTSDYQKIKARIMKLPKDKRKYLSTKEVKIECTRENYKMLHELNFEPSPDLYRKMNNVKVDTSWKKKKVPEKYSYLYPDQQDVFKFAATYDYRVLIASDMGSGKTNTSLSILDWIEDFPALIICPTTVRVNWMKQHRKWINDTDKIKIIKSSVDLKFYDDEYDIYIVNYQLLARSIVKTKVEGGGFLFMPRDVLEDFADNDFETVIIDEVHKMKGNDSQTTNAIRFVAEDAPSILALTGTPILNSSKDVFPILNLLRPEEFNNYQRFGHRFCYEKDRYAGKKKLQGAFYGSRNSNELNSILANGIMIRQTQKQIKEMRGEEYFIPNITVLPITPAKKSKYAEAEKAFGAGLNGGDDKKTSFGKLSKMRVEAWNLKKKECLEFIDDLLEESGDKIVVYVHNKAVMNDLKEYYKEKMVFIDGSVDTDNDVRDDVIQEFCEKDSVKIIGLSIGAGAEALDGLQFASHTMVFIQEAWNDGTKKQCYGRLSNRTGQEFKTNIFHLICEGTIEEMFLKLQDKKLKATKAVVDGETVEEGELMDDIFKYYKDKYKGK